MKNLKLITLTICFLSLLSSQVFGQMAYHRAKIFYNSIEDLGLMSQSGIVLDHVKSKKNIFIESDFSDFEIESARNLGLNVEILIPNVSAYYAERNKGMTQDIEKASSKNMLCEQSNSNSYNIPVGYDIKDGSNFGGFYTYDEMLQELDDMRAQYPQLISARSDVKDPNDSSSPSIHETSEGRFLQWVKISDNPETNESEPQILYDAIHHAREPAALQQLIFYMWYLLENYDANDEIKTLIDNSELYFIPCVNPDGYIYNETTNPAGGGMWRKNRRGSYGVDNNRNYSYITPEGNEVWNTSGTSNSTNSDVFAGTGPFSEPENRAMRYFVETHDFKMALNAHTYGELLLFPYGYDLDIPTPDNALFENLSSIMVAQNGYNNMISSGLYPAAGDSDDFMYGMLQTESGGTRNKILAFTPEIGASFWPNSSNIVDICQDMADTNLNALRLIHNFGILTDQTDSSISSTNTLINYDLERLGLQDNGIFTVSLEPISNNIASVGSSDSFSNLAQGDVVSGDIELILNSGINAGDLIEFNLVLHNGLFSTTTYTSKVYGSPTILLNEIADNTTTNWESSNWGATVEQYVSEGSSITDSPNGNYTANEDNTLVLSNSVSLAGALQADVSFMAKWDIETNYDFVQFEVSTDNGISWIPQCGNYTNIGVSDQTGAEGEPLYDGVQTNWVKENITLNDYLGENILFRFRLQSDNGVESDGFYFDDLVVSIIDQDLNTSSFSFLDFKVFPNPTSGDIHINTNLENYKLAITNVLGEVVLHEKELRGNHSISLENRPTGLYVLSLNHGDIASHFKIIKN